MTRRTSKGFCPFCPPVFLPEGFRRDCVRGTPIGFLEGGMPLLALVFTMGLAPCSSSAILTLSFSISSSLRTRLRFRTSTTRACSWSLSASSVESRSSAGPISRRSCLRLRVSLTRSVSTLLLNPVLKSFSIPRK